MTKYFSLGLIIFYNVVLMGMEMEPSVAKAHCLSTYEGLSFASMECRKLGNNYYQCSQALARYAQEENKEMFKHAWGFHKKAREYELKIMYASSFSKEDQKTSVLESAMQWYGRYYDTEEKIKTNIDNLIVKAFDKKDGDMLSMLFQGRELCIPQVKTKDLFESLWVMQNVDLVFKYFETYGNKDKNKTLKWIIKHEGKPSFIIGLLEKGYITIAPDKEGRTPAHLVIVYNRYDILDCLLDKWVDVNSVDIDGRTPLHYAVLYGDCRAVKVLLKNKNVNKDCLDKHGKKACDYINLSLIKKAKLHIKGEDLYALKERYAKIRDLF